jgi:hypothetical protein
MSLTCGYSSARSDRHANSQVTGVRVQVPLGHEPLGHGAVPASLAAGRLEANSRTEGTRPAVTSPANASGACACSGSSPGAPVAPDPTAGPEAVCAERMITISSSYEPTKATAGHAVDHGTRQPGATEAAAGHAARVTSQLSRAMTATRDECPGRAQRHLRQHSPGSQTMIFL